MKVLLAIVIMAAIALPYASAADPRCASLAIPAEVESAANEVVLADLLPANACPGLRNAARQVRLGSVPLAGSPRIFTGDEVRTRLQELNEHAGLGLKLESVPERVTVRRSAGIDLPVAPGGALSRSVARLAAADHRTGSGEGEAVRRGQSVLLIWDRDGIRVQVPAVCIDAGVTGSQIRARIQNGGRVVRAIVESAVRLRVIS
jgi:flagellar basal body P-ring formation chaperone FlgA